MYPFLIALLLVACDNEPKDTFEKETDTDSDSDTDTDTDSDADTDISYTSLEGPAYVFSELTFSEFLEAEAYNFVANGWLEDTMPPDYDFIVIIFDTEDVASGLTTFEGTFGFGERVGPKGNREYDFSSESNPLDSTYLLDDQSFLPTEDHTMSLGGFGFGFNLYHAQLSGTFINSFKSIEGDLSGCIDPLEITELEVNGIDVIDYIDDRPLNCNLGDELGPPDGWTYVMNYKAYDFL